MFTSDESSALEKLEGQENIEMRFQMTFCLLGEVFEFIEQSKDFYPAEDLTLH